MTAFNPPTEWCTRMFGMNFKRCTTNRIRASREKLAILIKPKNDALRFPKAA